MRSMHQVPPSRGKDSGKAELDSFTPEVCSGGRDSALADGQELSEDDDSRIAEDVDGGFGVERSLVGRPGTSEVVLPHQPCSAPYATLLLPPSIPPPAPTSQQQSSSGSVIRWERFLPFRSLKVLLVENDDSTRHVLSALLRNCSYEVTAVANGLEAWKILEDTSNHVDIILTEVVMPGLSGIGLLCKIINHKTCQNVPVIMMSSHDSMGLVFKCLSKGAVDFLIKPIRKNELKNLWQHVWRRCHSSSGSGSESGIQTQKPSKHRSSNESGNDSDNDHEYEGTSIDLNMQDGSDNGSGTQSSLSKHAADFESPQPVSPCNQLPEPCNSTCAHVIHPKTDTFSNEWITRTRIKDHRKREILDQDFLRKDSEFWMPGEPEKKTKSNPSENVPHRASGSQTDIYRKGHLPKNIHQNNTGKETTGSSSQAAHFTRGSVNHRTLYSNIEVLDSHTIIAKNKDKAISNMKGSSQLQSNMKKLTSLGESGTITNDVHILLRHTDLSAFTRYTTSAASNQVPVGCLGEHSLTDDTNSEAIKLPSLSKDAPLNHGSSSNNNDMGSSPQIISIKAPGIQKLATQTVFQGSHSSAFHPVQKRYPPTQEALAERIDHFEAHTSAIVSQPRVFHHVEQELHNNSQHHRHVHNTEKLPPTEHDGHALTIIESNVPQCGSSNVLAGGIGLNTANYSVNGSVSGSNHGSNALNCGSTVANVGRMNIDDDSGLAGRCWDGSGNEDQNASGSASGADQNQSRQTEAFLNKFRQKRKERCFGKKVRHQSRKKLVEQRPRVHEQVIQQPTCDQEKNDS